MERLPLKTKNVYKEMVVSARHYFIVAKFRTKILSHISRQFINV
jgi:hypothetical protein